MDSAQLPDLDGLDVEALKALVAAHRAEVAARDAEIAVREAEIEHERQALCNQIEELRRSSSEQIEHLKLVIEKLRRRVFGVKSEKIVIQLEQLELHLEELESSQAEMEAAVERVAPAAEPKTRSRRKPLPEHLPREVVSHAFHGDSCPDCGGHLRKFGEDVSEQLEYIPDSFTSLCANISETSSPSTITVGRGKKSHFDNHKQDKQFSRCQRSGRLGAGPPLSSSRF
jgi:DNA repair exonuclease SbcCD ATPase subunit